MGPVCADDVPSSFAGGGVATFFGVTEAILLLFCSFGSTMPPADPALALELPSSCLIVLAFRGVAVVDGPGDCGFVDIGIRVNPLAFGMETQTLAKSNGNKSGHVALLLPGYEAGTKLTYEGRSVGSSVRLVQKRGRSACNGDHRVETTRCDFKFKTSIVLH